MPETIGVGLGVLAILAVVALVANRKKNVSVNDGRPALMQRFAVWVGSDSALLQTPASDGEEDAVPEPCLQGLLASELPSHIKMKEGSEVIFVCDPAVHKDPMLLEVLTFRLTSMFQRRLHCERYEVEQALRTSIVQVGEEETPQQALDDYKENNGIRGLQVFSPATGPREYLFD